MTLINLFKETTKEFNTIQKGIVLTIVGLILIMSISLLIGLLSGSADPSNIAIAI